MKQMPQLDSLRFFAVLGVMVAHNWDSRLLGDVDWAGNGVRLFFVLSGFLITGILLDCRRLADDSRQSPMYFIRQFYARRSLRIFPIYYILIAVLVVLGVQPADDIWPWMVTFTTNIYITIHNAWIGKMGHLWSLAVEEQFYLLWPWIVLFASRKWLLRTLLLIIPLSSVYRFYAYRHFEFNMDTMDFKAATFTVAHFDSLGIGALLAILWHSDVPQATLQRYLTTIVLPVAGMLYTLCLVLYHYRVHPGIFFTVGDLFVAVMCAALVSRAGRGFAGVAGMVLECSVLRYLGKISYGLYVYHAFMPLLLIPIFEMVGIPLPVPGAANFVFSTMLTLGVASLSWHLIELPINSLKRFFPYDTADALCAAPSRSKSLAIRKTSGD
ncbi:MAG: acyltransferase [Nitrospira sp.]|jgi:peptidoglycan/LPS O-acetylase OafA/YrhL|nr:acyltransferase [Nitrospira sp.]